MGGPLNASHFSLEVGFLTEAEGWVTEAGQCLLLEGPNPGRAELEVLADLLVGAGESVVETDPLREDVGLTLWETVDCLTKCLDGRNPLGLPNRIVLVVVCDEVAKHGTVFTDGCFEGHGVRYELCFEDLVEAEA